MRSARSSQALALLSTRVRHRIGLVVLPGSHFFFFSAFTLSLVNATAVPLLPLLRNNFNLNDQQIAFLGSVSGLGMVMSNWPVGYLMHRLGPRRIMITGLIPLAGGPILSATAISFWQLLVGATLTGIGFATLLTANIGGLSELADGTNVGTTMGSLNGTMLVGTFVAPILSGTLAGTVSWRLSFAVAGTIASLLLVLLVVRYDAVAATQRRPIRRPPPSTSRHVFATIAPPLFLVFFLYFLVIYSRAAVVQFLFPLFGRDRVGLSVEVVGGLLSMGTLVTLAIVVPVGVLADRVGPKRMLIACIASLLLAELFILISPSLIGFSLCMILFGIAGPATSLVYTLFSQVSRQRALQRSLGAFRFFGDLGIVLGPVSMGFFVERIGFRAGLLGAMSLAAFALISLGMSLRQETEQGRA